MRRFALYLALSAHIVSACDDTVSAVDAPCDACARSDAFGVIVPDGGTTGQTDTSGKKSRAKITPEEALSNINAQRVASGLGAVPSNAALVSGCEAHIDYMVGEGKVVHSQSEASEFYTLEGAETGPRALIAGDVYDLGEAIDLWLEVLYHRIALLDSGTNAIGIAFRDGYACVDTFGMWDETLADTAAVYPGNGQTGVPTTLNPSISPLSPVPADWSQPNGTVVSLSFPAGTVFDSIPSLTMISAETGALVDGIVRHPQASDDPYADLLGATVALVPRVPLADGTTYQVEFLGIVDGLETNRIWQFTTAAGD